MTQLKKRQREQLRQLVLDATLRRLSTQEALSLIKDKLRVTITDRYYYVVKKNIIDSAGQQLVYLQKNRNAFLANFFERIHENYRYQRELWEMYYQAKAENDIKVRLDCIRELREVSVELQRLYDLLPDYKTSVFEREREDKPVIAPFRDTVVSTVNAIEEQELEDEGNIF
jgi:hypothetical protein